MSRKLFALFVALWLAGCANVVKVGPGDTIVANRVAVKLEPADFLGGKGFRFRYTVVRKADDVRLSGVAWGTVRDNELFALTFTAPRAGFFARHEKRVEEIARSARLKT